MNFRDRDLLISEANRRLAAAKCDHKKLVLIFSGVMTLMMAAVSGVTALLQDQIQNTGGLSGIGMRSILETAMSLLRLGSTLVIPFWTFGYVFSILGTVRGERMEPGALLTGFRRFGAVLRLNLYRGIRYMLVAMLCLYPSMALYLMTPLAYPVYEILMPLMESGTTAITVDEATMTAVSEAMMPAMAVYMLVFVLVSAPLFYRLRLADYILMDEPELGALGAVRKSAVLMHRNRLEMLKLDLRFWWFYGIQAVAMAVCYCPEWLSWFGVSLSETSQWVCYGVYLLIQFAAAVLAQNRVEATLAVAYEALLQPQPEPEAVQQVAPKNVPWTW